MNFRYLFPILFLTLAGAAVRAQTNPTTVDEVDTVNTRYSPRTYPTAKLPADDALRTFDAAFPERSVGFLSVYLPAGAPPAGYLLEGQPLDGSQLVLLPAKVRRAVERGDATAYAAAAIRGIDDNQYLVRTDGAREDRIELIGRRRGRLSHLRTLAVRNARSEQRSWITDVNGDALLDVMTEVRRPNGKRRRTVYLLDRQREGYRRGKGVDAPWESADW